MSNQAPPELTPRAIILAIVLAMILAASRVNLGVAGAAVLCSTLLSPLLDPFSHRIGLFLLQLSYSYSGAFVVNANACNSPCAPSILPLRAA